jgi:DNA repair protein RecO (recombination protein O)
MSREKSPAFIYKLIRYADSSAIAFAFTKDFGRIKLFVPKAYTKKGGVMSFIPGVLDFSKKQSDLSKFYAFDCDTAYYFYLNNHEIVIRLHLVFEIMDGLYQPEMPDGTLFDLLTKYDDTNFRKLTAYLIYFILKRSGVMYDLHSCGNCGTEENVFTISNKGLLCDTCAVQTGAESYCDRETAYVIKSMGNSQLYKNITITRKQEIDILKALSAYSSGVMEKPVKSLATLMEII